MIIDLHSHILPDLDDGAKSWEESIQMCRMAWADGTRAIVATPHVFNGAYEYDLHTIAVRSAAVEARLTAENIPLRIIQGAEVHARPDLPELLEASPELFLNGGHRYFLLEFPHSALPPRSNQLVSQLIRKDFIPIIVHPERNSRIQKDIRLLEHLVEIGALVQVTAMSLTGEFGSRAHTCVRNLLEHGCVHMVASDAHGTAGRPPILSAAKQLIEEDLGTEKATELFEASPEKILAGVKLGAHSDESH